MNYKVEFTDMEMSMAMAAFAVFSASESIPIELLPHVVSARDKVLDAYMEGQAGSSMEPVAQLLVDTMKTINLDEWR